MVAKGRGRGYTRIYAINGDEWFIFGLVFAGIFAYFLQIKRNTVQLNCVFNWLLYSDLT